MSEAGLTNLCFLPVNAKVMVIDPGLHDLLFLESVNIFKLDFYWFFYVRFPLTLDGSR